MHPEAARRGFNFILHQGGLFGIGSGFRAPGVQPVNRPGFAQPGRSFHEGQDFPSGRFYTAWDMVVVNPGFKHRAPSWSQVPRQGQQLALDYGWHMNIDEESWHAQPTELDGWGSWFLNGRRDLVANYPMRIFSPRPQPPQPPVPPIQPPTNGVIVEFTSRNLSEGAVGSDVKFFQRHLNDIAGQGLLLDGYFGPTTTRAIRNWQGFFGLTVDGGLGPKTQRSIIEVALQAS